MTVILRPRRNVAGSTSQMCSGTVAQIERLSVGGEPPAFAGIAYVAQFLERLCIVDVGRVVLPRELIDTVFYAGDSLAEFALRQADEYVGATCREVKSLNRGGAVLAGAFPTGSRRRNRAPCVASSSGADSSP